MNYGPKTRFSKGFVLVPWCLWGLSSSGFAGGTVTTPTQDALQNALNGGGTVVFACNGPVPLTNTITIAEDTLIDASGFDVTISGGNAVRLFQVNANVRFECRGLTFADGRFIGADGADGTPPAPGQDGSGAAILNLGGVVVLRDCTLTNNYVAGGNSGQDSSRQYSGSGGGGYGAAIFILGGSLNLTNCLILNNAAVGGQGSVLAKGAAGNAFGGGIYATDGRLVLESVTMMFNSTTGGAPVNFNGNLGLGGDGVGGAVCATNAIVEVSRSIFVSNGVVGGSTNPLTGPIGSALGSGSALGGAMFLGPNSSGTLSLCSFSNNYALGGPGVSVWPAGAAFGGAIFNAGQLEGVNSTFTANTCTGGVSLAPGRGQGGAFYSTNLLILNACTLNGNQAVGANASGFTYAPDQPGAAGEGGGVWNSGSLYATNCTLAANRAAGGGGAVDGAGGPGTGGGICVSSGAAVFENVTIAGNRADGGPPGSTYPFYPPPGPSQGGGLANTNGVVTVRNSIIANSIKGGEVWGTLADAGYNLCSDSTADFSASGSLNNVDPMLGGLSWNGGPTPTMPLLIGSPCRDAIATGFPPTDQRGATRPHGPAADRGAFEAEFVPQAPEILTQPTGATVRAGGNVIFVVVVLGTPPLVYQWLKEGTAIAGATSETLLLTNVQAADAATYSVTVTNDYGSAVSQGAVLQVDLTPRILVEPVSVVVSPGANTNFSVTADGPSLSYQWFHNDAPIVGASGPVLGIPQALAGAQGNYLVLVTNFAGALTSAVATLVFDASALKIVDPPKNQAVQVGYPATFGVSVSGIPPFTYQWSHEDRPISGATDSSLSLPVVTTNDSGPYRVTVTNGYGSLVSPAAYLTVVPGARPPLLVVGRVGNEVAVAFDAEVGRTYRVLSSTNLTAWWPIATNEILSAGPLQILSPIAEPSMFFRVVTP